VGNGALFQARISRFALERAHATHTIIETRLVRLRERHGSYPEMFKRLIRVEDASISFDLVSVANGVNRRGVPTPIGELSY
jgi:hypothetical protein